MRYFGLDLFRHAFLMVEYSESAYRGGRFDRWVEVKNRKHPAFSRVLDQFLPTRWTPARGETVVRNGSVANGPVDLDQYRVSGIWATCMRAANREPDMGECSEPKRVCRRSALALFGYAAVFGLGASPATLMVSDAGAQTPPATPATPSTETPKSGTERRQERRTGRAARRQERRTGRAERRQERRTGRTERRDGTTEQTQPSK